MVSFLEMGISGEDTGLNENGYGRSGQNRKGKRISLYYANM
jgi:hypothetical protein